MYNTYRVETYNKEFMRQIKEHNIPHRLLLLQKNIHTEGFTAACATGLEKIDQHVTSIRPNAEKYLMNPPAPFRATVVAKVQVQRILLLERLKRDNKNKKPCDQIISSLQT